MLIKQTAVPFFFCIENNSFMFYILKIQDG